MFGSNNNFSKGYAAGGELSRQISQSVANPSDTAKYMEQMLEQGRYESGWLEMFNPTTNTWDNRYFVFEKEMITHSKYSEEQLDMMKIQQYQANFNKKLNKQSDANVNDNQTSVVENEVVEIPIRNIVSFRAQNSISEGASHSTLTVSIKRNDREEKLKLRANSQDEMNKWQFALHRTVSILFPKLLESRKLKLQQKQQRDQKQNPMYNSDIIGLRHSSKGGATRDRSRSMEFDGEASDFRVLNDSNGNLSLLSTALHSSLNSFDLGDEDSSLNNTHTVRGRGTDAPSGIDRVSPSVLEEMEGLGFGHGRFRKDKISVHVDKDHAAQSTANTYTAHKSPKASDLNDCRSCFSFEKSDSGDHDGGDDAGASIIGGHALAALNTMTSIDSVSTTVHRPASISQYASPNTFSSTNTANLGSNFNSYSSNNGSRSVLSSHLSPNSALSGTSGSVHSQYMSKSIPLTSHMSGLAGSFGANCALNQEQARAYQLQQQENHMLQQQQEVNSRNHERRRASKASVMDEMDFIFTDTGPLNDEDFLLDSEGKKEDSCSTVSETSYSANSSRRVSLEDSGDGLFNFESDIANSVSNSPNRSPRVQKKSPESRGVPIIAQNNNNSSTNSASNANSHYGYSSNIPVPIPGSLSASIPISAPYMGSNMGTSVGKGQSYLMQGGLGLTGSVLSSSHKNDSPSQYFQGSTANPNPPHNRASPIIQPPQPSNPPPLKSSNTFGSIPLASSGATPPVPLAGSSKRRSSDAAMKLLSQWGGIVESENISSHGLNRHDTLVNWHVGACSKRGKRSANEDRFCVIPDFPEALELEAEFLDQKKASGNATRKISKYQRQQALVERCPCFVNIDVSPSESSSSEDIRRRVSSDEYSVTSNMSSFSMQSSLTQVKSNVPKAHMEEVEVVGRVGASKRHLYSHALSAKNEQNLGGISREGYFAVYDGHCGDYAAIHCANNLHLAIARHPTFATDLDLAIHETCVAFDQEIVDFSKENDISPGTTAVGLFIRGQRCSMYNIGDSSAVICSSGAARELTEGHKPGRADELERIKRANGWITTERELYLARLHQMDLTDPLIQQYAEQMTWVTIDRVCGEISVARSIGDAAYKSIPTNVKLAENAFISWPLDHNRILYDDVVIPDPEIISFNITQDDEFIILASDGLWDVVTPDLAVKRINDQLALRQEILNNGTGRDADGFPPLTYDEIAQDLCELAIRLGSSDNVTIVLLLFEHEQ